MNHAGSIVSKTEEEICSESTPFVGVLLNLNWDKAAWQFNWDASYMNTGLDAALSDSLDGMEYLFNPLWSFSL